MLLLRWMRGLMKLKSELKKEKNEYKKNALKEGSSG
jgi:hypothetical protein